MREIVVSVGALAASSATKISLIQTPGSAAALAIDGAASSGYLANGICASQSAGAAGNLTLNGSLVNSGLGAAVLGWPGSSVVVVSAGNDSGITFKISGTDQNGASVSQVLTGANTSRVATTVLFYTVASVAVSGATASTVTVGRNGTATLDMARQVIITSGGNDSGITFALAGTDWAGNPISETITGASGGAATSALDYLTVTSIKPSGTPATTLTVGTNSAAGSPWVRFDGYSFAPWNVQAQATGTVNYTVETTMDDPNSPTNSVARSAVNWDTSYAGITNATGNMFMSVNVIPTYARVLLNSGSGSVKATFRQPGSIAD